MTSQKVPRGILGGDVAAAKAIKGPRVETIPICDRLPRHLKAATALKKPKV